MTDKLPEEVMLDCKVFCPWQKLLVDGEMTRCLIVFECIAWNLWLFFQGQLQLFECVLDEALDGNQCSHGIGETNAFAVSVVVLKQILEISCDFQTKGAPPKVIACPCRDFTAFTLPLGSCLQVPAKSASAHTFKSNVPSCFIVTPLLMVPAG